jgi:23S rRNA (guanosine2251-2'-O)-methyltransferase
MSNYVYGRNPVKEHLLAGKAIEYILLATDSHGKIIDDVVNLAVKQNIPLKRRHRDILTQKLHHSHHQGIIAVLPEFKYSDVEDIFKVAQKHHEALFVAMLDGIQDPHNLGAIIRTADAAGVHGIIITKDHSAGITPTVEKVATGATAHVPIARVTNLARTMEELKTNGVWLYGATQNAEKSIYDITVTLPACIVLGSEGKGMRRLIKEKCDFLVRIPMFGKVDSLNVSVTAALMFYEVRKSLSGN